MSIAPRTVIDLCERVESSPAAAEAPALTSTEFQTLVQCLSTADMPLNVMSKALSIIGKHGAKFDKMKATMTAVVNVLAAEGNPPALDNTALSALVDLCRNATTKQEDAVRVVADLLIQVQLDSNFSPLVRQSAEARLKDLLTFCFKGVITKLLHFISDDREADTAAQLTAERSYAMRMMTELLTNGVYATQWTDELQQQVLKYMSLVFPTVTAEEFGTLCSVASALAVVKQSQGTLLLEALLKLKKLEVVRMLESISLLSQHIPREATFDGLQERLRPMLSTIDDTHKGLALARACTLAARISSVPVADALLTDILAALETRLPPSDAPSTWQPSSLSVLEALLLSVSYMGHRAGMSLLNKLKDDAFAARLRKLAEVTARLEKLITYYAKQKSASGTAVALDSEAYTCISNVDTMVQALAAAKLPRAPNPSWEHVLPLPVVRRRRLETIETAPLLPTEKKPRVESVATSKRPFLRRKW